MNIIKSQICVLILAAAAAASVGDPQLMTDHPWYPGELSCSTFERLFATQAALYERVTGRKVETDEDKALASWYWRNLHYAHGEEGKGDYFDQGFTKADWNRDYWFGLFAHGLGLCGTTHAQWTVEQNALLGHCRSRVVGVSGHNSFEVYLTGGAYGDGRWALLDHDISTVIYTPDGSRLLSIQEIMKDVKNLCDPKYRPDRQRGWRVAGLHDDDARGVYTSFTTAEYLSGYAGPPPMVHLRPGEKLRRYLNPGLEDGKMFVFWGMNYKTGGIPGPERSRTWVNQPEKMYGSKNGTGYKAGQFRYANAVYTYQPDFKSGSYKQAVIEESPNHVTFEFYTPYVIGCTPANDKPWGIYDPGGRNGLIIEAGASCPVSISTDQGAKWSDVQVIIPGKGLDLTDLVKGHQQYWIRFAAGAELLKESGLKWTTICQCNPAIIPHLKNGTNRITFFASGQALISAGPNKDQAEAHVTSRQGGTTVLELRTPRGERPTRIYAASWNNSGNPPQDAAYSITASQKPTLAPTPIVQNWKIQRRSPEPSDFWSQSFSYGSAELKDDSGAEPISITFSNSANRPPRKVEAHLAYQVAQPQPARVTFAWKEGDGPLKTASRVYPPAATPDSSWNLEAGKDVRTIWVEYSAE